MILPDLTYFDLLLLFMDNNIFASYAGSCLVEMFTSLIQTKLRFDMPKKLEDLGLNGQKFDFLAIQTSVRSN